MPRSTGCFSSVEVANEFGIPVGVARRMIDRMRLGVRVGRNRIIFTEDFDKLTVALQATGYLDVPDPTQPVVEDGVS